MRAQQIALFKTAHCQLSIARPAPGVVVLTLTGHDVGELGDGPFQELAHDFPQGVAKRELFIDARGGQGASVDVSGAWAQWLRAQKPQLAVVHFLTASRFIQLSADFVRKFAELGETMRIYTEEQAFDEELQIAIDRALSR